MSLRLSHGFRTVSAIVLWATLTACSGTSHAPSSARANVPQTVPVAAAAARQQDLPIYLNGLGSVAAYYTVGVKSRVDGQLVEVKFREGEFVRKGDLLALIDPRPYEVQLQQAEAQMYRDQSTLRDAKLNYQRYKELLENSGAISQQQVDTQRATVGQLEGAERNDEALVANAKLNLAYCHITAPVNGRVGLRQVDPGNMVRASDANPLIVITQLQPITVLFTLPEDQLQTVAQHMRRQALEVDAYSRDDQTKLATGKLLTIDNQIDQATGTGRLKAVFDNRNNELWPNQFVNVHLLLEIKRNVVVVPSAAVQRGPEGNYIYVVKPDNLVEVRPVTVAITEANRSQIASGISSNEIVVTDGKDKLQAGSHVEFKLTPAGPADQTPAMPAAKNLGPGTQASPLRSKNRSSHEPKAGTHPPQGTSSQ